MRPRAPPLLLVTAAALPRVHAAPLTPGPVVVQVPYKPRRSGAFLTLVGLSLAVVYFSAIVHLWTTADISTDMTLVDTTDTGKKWKHSSVTYVDCLCVVYEMTVRCQALRCVIEPTYASSATCNTLVGSCNLQGAKTLEYDNNRCDLL